MSGTSGNGRVLLPQPPPTKTIVVYRNGDAFYPGRKFVINQRQMSTFDSFLSSVTHGVEAPFGAVRNIYTPREGHKIFELDHLEHGERYVAAGAERFKRLDYHDITMKKPQRKKRELIRPVVHSRIIVSARWRKIINEPCTINVFTNGDILVPPARILIPKYTLRNWEIVLAMVTEKVHLRRGAVHRLCLLDGTPVAGAVELENNQYYVAVGAEKFRFLPYIQRVPNKGIIRDYSYGAHNDFLPAIKKGKHAKNEFSDRKGPSFGEDQNHTDSYFYTKPERDKQQKQGSKIPLFSTGAGSIFNVKATRQETVGATEVQEDGRTRVDLPIDQVEAKIVDAEQYDYKYPRPESGGQSPFKAFLRSTDAFTTPGLVSEGSRKISANASPNPEVSQRDSPPNSPRARRTQSPAETEHQDTKEEELSSTLRGMRLRMSKFFKEKSKR